MVGSNFQYQINDFSKTVRSETTTRIHLREVQLVKNASISVHVAVDILCNTV